MTDSQVTPPKNRKKKHWFLAWPMVRKIESLAFMAMFLAVPFFAFRVVDYTTRQLTFNNAAHDLVKDLRRVKQMASDFSMEISVTAFQASSDKPAGYLIKAGRKTMEEVVLPSGVGLQGSVIFQKEGTPDRPGSFDMRMGNREVSVDVDMSGVVKIE